MTKASKTEHELTIALNRLVAGEYRKSDGRFTQKNIALEAGVSRATFNRYPNVVEEYRKVKRRSGVSEEVKPFTHEEKNQELQESNTGQRKPSSYEKLDHEQHLASARQEIYILSMALQARENTIAARDREIAELKRQLAAQGRGIAPRLDVVR